MAHDVGGDVAGREELLEGLARRQPPGQCHVQRLAFDLL